jgi:hypothetical protein
VTGELVVIVAGVLIALWVDNLNEARKEEAQVRAYLSGILVDLASDSVDLADRRATATRSLNAADRLIGLHRSRSATVPPDSLASWILYTAFVDNFQVLDHTYQEVLGAVGLSLIPDDGLRRQIAGYYRSIESADFFTDYYKKEEADFWDLLENRLSPDDFEAVSRVREGPNAAARMDVGRVLTQLRGDRAFVNAVQMNRHWTELRLDVNERRIGRHAELSAALRTALRR